MPGLGWSPDIPDIRDRAFAAPAAVPLPKAVDLRLHDVGIVDQGITNACVGRSGAQMVEVVRKKLGLHSEQLSGSFLYYFARRLQDWQGFDDGAYIRDAMKVLVADGICSESEWPFSKPRINERPPQTVLRNALAHKTTQYLRMKSNDGLYHLKNCLAQGYPFVAGIPVYSSMLDDSVTGTGVVPMPKASDSLVGGHAIRFMGYFEDTKYFICPNTWGSGYGDKGYYYLPFDYVKELADDFWTIRMTG